MHDIDAMKCAIVSGKLGAGRTKAGDPVNYAVGLNFYTAVGEKIEGGTFNIFLSASPAISAFCTIP